MSLLFVRWRNFGFSLSLIQKGHMSSSWKIISHFSYTAFGCAMTTITLLDVKLFGNIRFTCCADCVLTAKLLHFSFKAIWFLILLAKLALYIAAHVQRFCMSLGWNKRKFSFQEWKSSVPNMCQRKTHFDSLTSLKQNISKNNFSFSEKIGQSCWCDDALEMTGSCNLHLDTTWLLVHF